MLDFYRHCRPEPAVPRNVSTKCIYSNAVTHSPDSRISQMLRSILTSRVLLNIRAQRGEEPVHSDGLTELNTDHLYAGDTQPGPRYC